MKKKILFINGHLNTGGVEKALVDILKHLDYNKYEVDLLLLEGLGDYTSEIPEQVNVILRSLDATHGPVLRVLRDSFRKRDWFTFKMRLIFLLTRFFGISKISLARKMLLGKREYDCAIGFRSGICTRVASFAARAKRRLTWWHHGEINVNPNTYLAEVRNCDQIISVSEGCSAMLAEAMPELKNRLITIHNMVDEESIQTKAKAFQPEYEKGVLHLVSVGRLAPEKHFENAIYAAQKLKERGIAFRWHIVGDGALREELQNQAIDAGVDDCVIFEGNQVNPYPFVLNADIFVHPSYVESFGLVVVEALALGRPCVVTRSSGVEEFLIDGVNAVLTERSEYDLFVKICRLAENVGLRDYITSNSVCPKRFMFGNIVDSIDNLLTY